MELASLGNPVDSALVALLVPLGAALCIAILSPLRRRGKLAGWLSVLAALVALAASSLLLFRWQGGLGPELFELRWLPRAGGTLARVGVRVDGISVVMLTVVTLVATCVQVFSLGYMSGEPGPALGRYFAYHSLFIFSMSLLVLAPNLLVFLIGWELVGLTSYLLIGFYYQKPSAARAAVKAFWTTKFADMGLFAAVVLLFAWTGDFSWEVPLSPQQASLITLLLFLAVMGKSAQFPLHVWLPDAMEGPTPVSALLHAATMVAAGVYLIVRTGPLFSQAPDTLTLMAYLGSFTALFAAVIAVVQTDIKRVLAYSTCSQLGYMVAGLGAGSVMSGFFHLTTHAAFKALLFLAAGSVIHAVGSNELGDMGGLARRMRLTTTVFVIGALALAGVPLFAGFFSKDFILETVFNQKLWLPLGALLLSGFLTAFYMGRVIALAFFGTPSSKAEHAHESGPTMALPLIALAFLSVAVGWLGPRMAEMIQADYAFHLTPVGAAATLLALGGLFFAWLVYARRAVPSSVLAWFAPIGEVARSGALDRLYGFAFRRVVLGVAALAGWFDRYIVDGLMNFIAWLAIVTGQRLRRIQTGNVLDYVYAVVAGAALLIAWGMVR